MPKLPELPLEVDEDEETVKIVQLVKSNEPLVSFQLFYDIILLVNCPNPVGAVHLKTNNFLSLTLSYGKRLRQLSLLW